MNPLDEPTTINRDDLPRSEFIPIRHPDTDLREPVGMFGWPIIVALVIGLLLLGYYWLIR